MWRNCRSVFSAMTIETDCITFLYQDGEFDFLPIAP